MRKFFILAALLTSASYAFAKQWVIFIADDAGDGSLVGHAYVSFVKENPIQKQTMLIGCWGFYPKRGQGLGVFGYVDSEFRDDLARAKDVSLMVEVSDKEFDACLFTKSEWEAKNILFLLKIVSTSSKQSL